MKNKTPGQRPGVDIPNDVNLVNYAGTRKWIARPFGDLE